MSRWATRTVMQLGSANSPFRDAGTAVCNGTSCNANDVIVPGQLGSFLLHPLDAGAEALQAAGSAADTNSQTTGRWVTATSQPFTTLAPTKAG
jgi:hypothetical protein